MRQTVKHILKKHLDSKEIIEFTQNILMPYDLQEQHIQIMQRLAEERGFRYERLLMRNAMLKCLCPEFKTLFLEAKSEMLKDKSVQQKIARQAQ